MPGAISQLLPPGTVSTVTTRVQTPRIPQVADVILLVDGTFSMFGTIQNVKDGLNQILGQFSLAADGTHFGVVAFRDTTPDGDGDAAFEVLTPLTGSQPAVVAAVNGLQAGGGSPDAPEDWINALVRVSAGDAGAFRPQATHLVVLVGDSSSHDPSGPEDQQHTLSEAISALKDQNIKVLAIGVGSQGDGLDSVDQATQVTGATSGALFDGINPTQVATTIGAGLGDLPITARHRVNSCDLGLAVALDPPNRTITSGTDASFGETVTVSRDAPQGRTLSCTVQFALTDFPADGSDPPDAALLRQTISVQVQDVTAPEVILEKEVT
jgi:uncharacterized protein YegL